MKRPSGFDLARALAEPGFTPRSGDLGALFDLVSGADDDAADQAERALLHLGAAAAEGAIARSPGAGPRLGWRLQRLVGRVASQGDDRLGAQASQARGGWYAFLRAGLCDPDAKVRRTAALALGKLPGAEAEEALLAQWEREEHPSNRRSLAEALGKVGGTRSLTVLRDADTGDSELLRVVSRAILVLEREAARQAPAGIRLAVAPCEPLELALRCRGGLESLLAEEVSDVFGLAARPRRGQVRLSWAAPLVDILRSRLTVSWAFPLQPLRLGAGEPLADAVVRGLTSDGAVALLQRFTSGPIRYRLSWAQGGHRRSLVWDVAQQVSARRPELVNDPRQSLWEVEVSQLDGQRVGLTLAPQRYEDGRFDYLADRVAAGSHPTVAAALARCGGVRQDDVIWDPFAGSGVELIERALLGKYARLIGSDISPTALAAARANGERAGVERLELWPGDARTHQPAGLTLVLTNPPMGWRTQRQSDLRDLFDEIVDHVARLLVPNGRFVWISPMPSRTMERALARGLELVREGVVDLGGFPARLQQFRRPGRP